jgi:hypothetical protein
MRLRAILTISLCAALLAAVPAFAGRAILGKTPVATLLAENAAFNAGDFKSLWSAYTPNYQSHCGPYAKFVKNLTAAQKQLAPVTTKNVSAKISGSRALLTYRIFHNGKLVADVKASSPDVYVKKNGLWYDEYEPAHGC